MSQLRAGVLGVGTWGEKHARVYASLPGVELVGVHDADGARAAEVAARHGARAFASADELLRECQAVSVAVPTVAHREAVERAVAAGCHVLVEKPMAATVAEADSMIDAARRAGVRLQVGQVERFNPAMLAAGPHVGGVKFIECHRLALFQPRSLDVDVVFDLMIHDLDLVLQAVGRPPLALSAVGVAVLSENVDIANARLEFEDGCVANLTASRVSQERLRRIRFFGGESYLSVDLFERRCELLSLDREVLAARAVHPMALAAAIRREAVPVAEGEPLTLQLAAFTASLRGDGAGAASAAAGRDALAVAEAVREAMEHRSRRWAQRPSAVS